MKKTHTWLYSLLLALLLAVSCADGNDHAVHAAPAAPVAEANLDARSGEEARNTPAARMVIKTGSLTLEHDDPESLNAQAQQLAEQLGGFVVASNVDEWDDNSNRVTLTLRVPAANFDSVLAALRDLGEVTSETVSGEDVTEEFMDLQAQLRNQRALETRFLALLAQAQTVSDTIEVERELARVRTEIERMEGRAKYLNDRVDMSTVSLTVNPTRTLSAHSTTIGSEVADALGDSGEIIAVVVGGLIRIAAGLLPIGVLLTMFGLAIRAAYRRRKA